ncbi:acyl carrier protein [Streptomyces sp. NPDC048291]|uniref:acyl carrier protein n=1 Tax=unclassified Streptomyces TaxID=2593676 RepID=UPI003713B01C
MAVDLAALEKKLLDWVVEWNEGEYDGELDAETDLFAAGVLDSMGFTGLIAYLEDETGIEFDFEHAEEAGAVSLRALLAYCFPTAAATDA